MTVLTAGRARTILTANSLLLAGACAYAAGPWVWPLSVVLIAGAVWLAAKAYDRGAISTAGLLACLLPIPLLAVVFLLVAFSGVAISES